MDSAAVPFLAAGLLQRLLEVHAYTRTEYLHQRSLTCLPGLFVSHHTAGIRRMT
jgi:hypothetical protein